MGGETAVLPADVASLRQLVVHLQEENSFLSSRASALEEELRLLRHKIFGRRSEQLNEEELKHSLFDEAELTLLKAGLKAEQPEASVEVAAHRRAKPGQKAVACRFAPRRSSARHSRRGEEVQLLRSAPGTHRGGNRGEAGHHPCADEGDPPHSTQVCLQRMRRGDSAHPVKIAPVPAQIIEKGIATPGLLAFILVGKFCDAIPFYRQEKQFARIGVELSRVDFCNWAVEAALKCDPLVEIFLGANPRRAGGADG